jgi:hypothetical protein
MQGERIETDEGVNERQRNLSFSLLSRPLLLSLTSTRSWAARPLPALLWLWPALRWASDPPLYNCRLGLPLVFGFEFGFMPEFGSMPVWSSSPVLAGRVRRSVAVFFLVLLPWLESEAEKQGVVDISFNKPGSIAASIWSSPAEDVRRQGPSCLCSSWPIGGSPRPRSSGISTSWPHAISEALELQLEIHQCCHPKWFVPGDGVAALGVELVVLLRWRRASRIRLLFIFSFRGPSVKVQVLVVLSFPLWTFL